METEVWKDVVGYEGIYKVSNLGRVKKLARMSADKHRKPFVVQEIIMRPSIRKYERLVLVKNKEEKTMLVHRIVAMAFLPNPLEKPNINHIDGNKVNNLLNNLEWVTQSENCKHSFSVLNNKKGCFVKGRKMQGIAVTQFSKNGEFVASYESISEASRKTKAQSTVIGLCLLNKRKTAGGYVWVKI